MHGFVLVNRRNDVVLYDGTRSFLDFLASKIRREVLPGLHASSLSSGIFSDESLPSISETQPIKTRNKSISLREVTHIFLPLISMNKLIGATDRLHCMSSSSLGRIRYRQLPNQYLIIEIGKEGQREVLDILETALSVNFGALLDYIDTDIAAVRDAKIYLDKTLNEIFRGHGSTALKHDFSIRKTSYYEHLLSTLQPVVASISSQLHLFIGNNRCLLVNGHDVMCSINSSSLSRSIWNNIRLSDIQFLIDQCGPPTEKHDIKQFWLRGKSSVVPCYLNVIRFRLNARLYLVCLSEVKENPLIRTVSELVYGIDYLDMQKGVIKEMEDITRRIDLLSKQLNDCLPNKDNGQYSYLRNPVKTANYMLTLFTRFTGELDTEQNASTSTPTRERCDSRVQHMRNISARAIRSIRSGLSSLSLHSQSTITSAVTTASTLRLPQNLGLSVRSEAMLANIRRQLSVLLRELCTVSMEESVSYKLPLFRSSLKRIMVDRIKRIFAESDLGAPESEKQQTHYMHPLRLSLEMLGYSLKCNNPPMRIEYISDELRTELAGKCISRGSTISKHVMTGRSGEPFAIYKVRYVEYEQKSMWNRMKKAVLAQSETQVVRDMTLTVVFNGWINDCLAERQIALLKEKLQAEMFRVLSFYS